MSSIRDKKSRYKEDFNASIGNDSVFDWGGPLALPNAADEDCQRQRSSSDKNYVSRYDPNAMNRIADIVDLAALDDSSGTDSDDDGAIIGHGSGVDSKLDYGIKRDTQAKTWVGACGGNNNALFCRRSMTIVSLVAVIMAASLFIGISVLLHSPPSRTDAENNNLMLPSEQELLEISERIVVACSDQRFLDADISECQNLCNHSNNIMCCFENGEHSCHEDERKDCAVYAGCEAFVKGVSLGAPEDNVE